MKHTVIRTIVPRRNAFLYPAPSPFSYIRDERATLICRSNNTGTDGTYPDYFLPIWESQRQTSAIVVCGPGYLCYFHAMARLPRVVIVDIPHHVTQRGNARQVILASDADRVTYLELLREYSQLYALSLLGYCLMSNHVHLIAVPQTPEALSQSLKQAHGRYAAYWNAQQSSTGHVWQGRFYSCPLDESHLWAALRYVELNNTGTDGTYPDYFLPIWESQRQTHAIVVCGPDVNFASAGSAKGRASQEARSRLQASSPQHSKFD